MGRFRSPDHRTPCPYLSMSQVCLARKTTRALAADFASHSPDHAVAARRGNPAELVGVHRAVRIRIVRPGFEYRAAARAVNFADTLDEPPGGASRVGEQPQ